MADSTQHSPLPVDPEEEQFSALLRELRELPSVSAPIDFEYRLKRAIASEHAAPALPWWKRLLQSGQMGGFRIPAYAYGAVAAVVILVFSYYVYQRTNIKDELRGLEQTEEGIREPGFTVPRQESPGQQGPQTDREPHKPGTAVSHGSPERSEGENRRTTAGESSSTSDIPAAGGGTEKRMTGLETPLDKQGKTETEKDGNRVSSESKIPASQSTDPAKIRSMRRERDAKESAVQEKTNRAVQPQLRAKPDAVEMEMAPIRGFILDEDLLALRDSVRTADSLRRIDSLRRAR